MQEATVAESVQSAKEAGLVYVSDRRPGITRERAGRGFRYTGPDGEAVRDKETLARIKALVIPPAWTDVWICPNPIGHLQATGRDERGRKQYRYHDRWREVRDETKYARMVAFGQALPRIRGRVAHDLSLPGLPREKVLATVVSLMEMTLIRVGNEQYARSNRSFGLTTMRNRHVKVDGSQLRFKFKGKSGKTHSIGIKDRRLAAIVRRCQELPGQELFEYVDDDGVRRPIELVGRERLPQGDQRRRFYLQRLPHLGRHRAGCADPAGDGAHQSALEDAGQAQRHPGR